MIELVVFLKIKNKWVFFIWFLLCLKRVLVKVMKFNLIVFCFFCSFYRYVWFFELKINILMFVVL